MPKPRTPTNVLQLRGSDKEHPDRMRARENEPEVTEPLPANPPSYLSDAEKKVWPELLALLPAGTAKSCDRVTFEIFVSLWTEHRLRGIGMKTTRMAELRRLAGEFGMSPASRSKVMAPKGKSNPFDKF